MPCDQAVNLWSLPRSWCCLSGPCSALQAEPTAAREPGDRPNIVIVFTDDLGYGDLACFGHPTIATPNLDRMAAEGQKWTNFYVAACVCTPSRAGLMTGRLPVRSGMTSAERRVLFSDSAGGIPASEVTLPEALKTAGYATGIVGKWHLGHLPRYLPTNNGFDSYFGIPYSNDMDRIEGSPKTATRDPKVAYFNVPLMRDTKVVERPADQHTITKRYTEEAVKFIEEHKSTPFFLYLAHNMPHVPLFRSERFEGVSLRGRFGDVIEEIDWSVGQVLETLRKNGLAENTMVVFTSDNGPWLRFDVQGGSAGLLRDGKGSTWEGGMREPTIAWWPGKIAAGSVVRDLGSTLDLYVTAITLAGGAVPTDRVIDGYDIRPALFGDGPSPRNVMFYYRGTELYAVRKGQFKAHFVTEDAYGEDRHKARHDPPLLYHLGRDPGESVEIGTHYPEVIDEIRQIAEEHSKTVEPVENQLESRIGEQ